jgi:hypothetical protein
MGRRRDQPENTAQTPSYALVPRDPRDPRELSHSLQRLLTVDAAKGTHAFCYEADVEYSYRHRPE